MRPLVFGRECPGKASLAVERSTFSLRVGVARRRDLLWNPSCVRLYAALPYTVRAPSTTSQGFMTSRADQRIRERFLVYN